MDSPLRTRTTSDSEELSYTFGAALFGASDDSDERKTRRKRKKTEDTATSQKRQKKVTKDQKGKAVAHSGNPMKTIEQLSISLKKVNSALMQIEVACMGLSSQLESMQKSVKELEKQLAP